MSLWKPVRIVTTPKANSIRSPTNTLDRFCPAMAEQFLQRYDCKAAKSGKVNHAFRDLQPLWTNRGLLAVERAKIEFWSRFVTPETTVSVHQNDRMF